MKNVKLYGYPNSPFVRKTTCFLLYKGIEFTHVPVDPLKPKKSIGFTGGRQVPVLQIGDKWKRESSAHAYWLDEDFPDKPPLCPEGHRQTIATIDDWISGTFLPSIFRSAIDGKMSMMRLRGAWRLATLMNANSPIPIYLRAAWPFLLKRVKFIQDMAQNMDLTESHEAMNRRILSELIDHLGDGPFIGGLEAPTMLDLALFPNLVWNYMFGVHPVPGMASHPTVNAWLQRVANHLPDHPFLTPENLKVRSMEEIWLN